MSDGRNDLLIDLQKTFVEIEIIIYIPFIIFVRTGKNVDHATIFCQRKKLSLFMRLTLITLVITKLKFVEK